MYEFKLNYYFTLFKDIPLCGRKKFRENFIKKYGNFQYLEELIIMLENYQIEKYGVLLRPDTYIKCKEEYVKIVIASCKRERYRKANEKKNI